MIVYYHLVSDSDPEHIEHLYAFKSPREFVADLDWLLKRYKPLKLQDFIGHMQDGSNLSRHVLITFDDGLRECFEVVAPILNQKGVPGVFFLCSGFLDNQRLSYDHKKSVLLSHSYKTRWSAATTAEVSRFVGCPSEQVANWLLAVSYRDQHLLDGVAHLVGCDFRKYLLETKPYLTTDEGRQLLAMGHAVGAHSIDHPPFNCLNPEEQFHQAAESLRCVRAGFQLDYGAFSFPHSEAPVEDAFFRKLHELGLMDVAFGRPSVPNSLCFSRICMERSNMGISEILARSYGKQILKRADRKRVEHLARGLLYSTSE